MARTKRIFREWQHPRDHRGRFARKGSPEWVRAAAAKFRAAEDGLKAGTSAPGMPGGQRRGIARGAKAEALFASHDASVTTGLGRRPVQGPAPRPASTTQGRVPQQTKRGLVEREATLAGRKSLPPRPPTEEERQANLMRGAGSAMVAAAKGARPLGEGRPVVPGRPLSPSQEADLRAEYIDLQDRIGQRDGVGGQSSKLRARAAELEAIAAEHGVSLQPQRRFRRVDTPRDNGQAGGMTSTTASNPRISAQDKRRIRIAVEDHAADFIGGPLGLGKDDAARYTSEGHLGDLVGKYGLNDVWAEVAHVIETNPDLLKKTGRKDRTAARSATSSNIADEALTAMKSGRFTDAIAALNRGEDHDPDFRQNGRHSWNDMRDVVLKRKAQADADAAEKAQADADKPTPEDLAVARELYKLHPTQRTFDPKASNAARDEARAKAEAEVDSLLPSSNFSRSTLRARMGSAAGAVGAFQFQRDEKRAEVAQARELLAKIKDPKLRDEYRTGVLRPLEHDEEVLMAAIARQERDLDRARQDLNDEIKRGGQQLIGRRDTEAYERISGIRRSGGRGYGGGRGAEVADMVDAAPDRSAAIKALDQSDRTAAQDEANLRGLHRDYLQKTVENALRGVDLKNLTPEERQRWADSTGNATRGLVATLAARTRRDQALSRLDVLRSHKPGPGASPEMRTKLNDAIGEEQANLDAAQAQLATLEPKFQANLNALTTGVNELRAGRGLKAAKLNTGTMDKGYAKTLERLSITPQANPPAPPAAPKGAIERASDTIAAQRGLPAAPGGKGNAVEAAREAIIARQRAGGDSVTAAGYVNVHDVRQDMAARGFTEAEQDAAFDKLLDDPTFSVMPWAHGPTRLDAEARGKPIDVGGENRHIVNILNAPGGQPIGSESERIRQQQDAAENDNLGLASEPSTTDIIKGMAKRAAAVTGEQTGATAYDRMDRGTLLVLARQAKVPVRGKSNEDIAAALRAKDDLRREARQQRLNPTSVGAPSTQHEQHTTNPGTTTARRQGGYQTFAQRMAGDMSERDLQAAHAASDERRAQLRAQEAERARQVAEAEANDTRTEREKLTEKLQQERMVDSIDRRSGRVDPRRVARIKAAEARLAELDTEDRKAKIKELGARKGDKVKTAIGEFEVTGKTADGYLRVLRPDGRRGSVNPNHVEAVTKAPKAEAAREAAPGGQTPDPGGRRADHIARTLAALPAGFVPDEQTRQQYVVESRGVWHVGMGEPYYLQDMRSKAEALQWIVDAQRSRERLRSDPIHREDSTPYGKYGSLSRADFDRLPPARQREIAAELAAARRNPTGDGGAALLIGKFGLSPTPAQREAGSVTAHPSAIEIVERDRKPTTWIDKATGREVTNPGQVGIVRGDIVKADSDAGKAAIAARDERRATYVNVLTGAPTSRGGGNIVRADSKAGQEAIAAREARLAERRGANLDKARTAQREMRREEIARSTEPKDNGSKIRALENGVVDTVSLYKTANAGPSGQRTHALVGKVEHTPDHPSGEFRIRGRDGEVTGWATRTPRNGKMVYAVHSEGPNGEQRLEGWAGELATAADVLNNGEFVARGYGADARRASAGSWEGYAGRNMPLDELELTAARDQLRRAREHAANPNLAPIGRRSAEREVEVRQRQLDELLAERRGGQVDTSRDSRQTGGVGNTPTTEASMKPQNGQKVTSWDQLGEGDVIDTAFGRYRVTEVKPVVVHPLVSDGLKRTAAANRYVKGVPLKKDGTPTVASRGRAEGFEMSLDGNGITMVKGNTPEAPAAPAKPRSKLAHSQDALLRANAAVLDAIGHQPGDIRRAKGGPAFLPLGTPEAEAEGKLQTAWMRRKDEIIRGLDSPYGTGTSGDAGAKLIEKGYVRRVPGHFLPEITAKGREHIASTSPTPRPVKKAGPTGIVNRPADRAPNGYTGTIPADRKERYDDKAFTDHVKMLTLVGNTGDEVRAWGFDHSDQPIQVGDEVVTHTFDRFRRGIVTDVTRDGKGTVRVAYATPSGGYVQETTAPHAQVLQLVDPAKRPRENRAALLPPPPPEARGPRRMTDEEKAASKAARAEAEKAASAARRQQFFDEKINGIAESLSGGSHADNPGWHLQMTTEEGLVSLAKHLGVKVPNREKNSLGNPLPRDRDALRASIVEAVRERQRAAAPKSPVAPATSPVDSIAKHTAAPVSVDIFENGAGQLDVGPVNNRAVYDISRHGDAWHAEPLQGSTKGNMSASTVAELAKKVANAHGVSGTVSIEDERDKGRSLTQRFEHAARTGPAARLPGIPASTPTRLRDLPIGTTDAQAARAMPRLDGESDLMYQLRTAPSDHTAETILKGYSVGGLRAIARDNGVTVPSGATKPQLIEAILTRRKRFHDSRSV